jgi:3-oxoacid CoA-transferase B subunit
MSNKLDPRIVIAKRCALELEDGDVVNLGFGIPTAAADYLPPGVTVWLHSENGCIGLGGKPPTDKIDSDCTNASGDPMTVLVGACYLDLTTSFGAMRNGYIKTSILGGLEVDEEGNLANWAVKKNGRWWPGIGGAMDLCYGVPKIVAALQHIDKAGDSKIKKLTKLPLTGRRCVKTIITDKAVFNVVPTGLILREALEGMTVDDIRAITEASFEVANDFKPMPV